MTVYTVLGGILGLVVALVFFDWYTTRRRIDALLQNETEEERRRRQVEEILREVDKIEPRD